MNRRSFLGKIAVGAAAISFPVRIKATESTVGRPNIIFIMADDMGYGDLSCYGATKIKTLNMDAIAAEGIRFTDAHSPSAVCTPTRYGVLTGRYCWRTKLKSGVLNGDRKSVV